MHGNVWEWCWDGYGEYEAEVPADPTGPKKTSQRVIRGGSRTVGARNCRSALRRPLDPSFRVAFVSMSRYDYLGFRLAVVPLGEPRE